MNGKCMAICNSGMRCSMQKSPIAELKALYRQRYGSNYPTVPSNETKEVHHNTCMMGLNISVNFIPILYVKHVLMILIRHMATVLSYLVKHLPDTMHDFLCTLNINHGELAYICADTATYLANLILTSISEASTNTYNAYIVILLVKFRTFVYIPSNL